MSDSPENRTEPSAPSIPPPVVRHVGDHIDRYVLDGVLGRGGMGTTYSANDPELGRAVALKLLSDRHSISPDALVEEARALAKLSHPNVVTIYDAGVHDGEVWIAMEKVTGGTLRTWQRTERGWRAVVEVYLAAARGLAAAHAAGLIHRDFKPDNVLIGSDGRPRVADFGLAVASDAAHSSDPAGTPGYMAPEQLTGDPVDERSDQFSFCTALWEALHARRPFRLTTTVALQPTQLAPSGAAHRDEPSRDPTVRVPSWLSAIVRRGFAHRPADRWPSMDTLIGELEGVPRRRRRRAVLAAIAVAAIAATIALWLAWANARDERRRAEDATVARLDAGYLSEARQLIDIDPTAAAAVLGQLRADSPLWDGPARSLLIDAANRGLARQLPANRPFGHLTFARDGRRLAGSCGHTIRVWDLGERSLVDLAAPPNANHQFDHIIALAFVGDRVTTVDARGGVRAWDVATATSSELTPAAVAGGELLLASIAPDGAIGWITDSNELTIAVPGMARQQLPGYQWARWSLDGSYLLAWSRTVREVHWIGRNGVVARREAHSDTVFDLAGDDSRAYLSTIATLYEPRLDIIDLAEPATVIRQRPIFESRDSFQPKPFRLALGGARVVATANLDEFSDSPVAVLQANDAYYLRENTDHFVSIAVAADGQQIATATRGGVRLWPRPHREVGLPNTSSGDLVTGRTGSVVHAVTDHRFVARDLTTHTMRVISLDDASASQLPVNEVGLRRITTGRWTSGRPPGRFMFQEHFQIDDRIASVSSARDGSAWVTRSDKGFVALWNDHGGRIIAEGRAAAIAPDGKRVAIIDHHHQLQLWSDGKLRPLHDEMKGPVAISSQGTIAAINAVNRLALIDDDRAAMLPAYEPDLVTFSPDGTLVADGGFGFHLWRTTSEQVPLLGGRQVSGVSALLVTDRLIFSGAENGDLRWWDIATGATVVLRGHHAKITALAISDDQRTLISGDQSGHALVWNLADRASRPLDARSEIVGAGFAKGSTGGFVLDHGGTLIFDRDDLPHDGVGLRNWIGDSIDW